MHSLFKDPRPEAALILSDGTVLLGRSFGASVSNVAEVVFNTAMTGYQEVLTDPSYTGQIVTLTAPTSATSASTPRTARAAQPFMPQASSSGDVPAVHSNFRSEKSLPDYLVEQGVPAIAGVDTRRLTRILRTKGAQARRDRRRPPTVRSPRTRSTQAARPLPPGRAWRARTLPRSSPARLPMSGPKAPSA